MTNKVAKANLTEASMIPSQLDNLITDVKKVGEIGLLGNDERCAIGDPIYQRSDLRNWQTYRTLTEYVKLEKCS